MILCDKVDLVSTYFSFAWLLSPRSHWLIYSRYVNFTYYMQNLHSCVKIYLLRVHMFLKSFGLNCTWTESRMAHVGKFYGRHRLIRSAFGAFFVQKTYWNYNFVGLLHHPFWLQLNLALWVSLLIFFKLLCLAKDHWRGFSTRIWSILLINPIKKCCIHSVEVSFYISLIWVVDWFLSETDVWTHVFMLSRHKGYFF